MFIIEETKLIIQITKQNKTKQNKTKRNRTKQDKTKRSKNKKMVAVNNYSETKK